MMASAASASTVLSPESSSSSLSSSIPTLTSALAQPKLRIRVTEDLLEKTAKSSPVLFKFSPPSIFRPQLGLETAAKGRSGKTKAAFTMLTASRPIVVKANLQGEKSKTLWVHLKTSICTEWEHSSMVLTPGSQIGASVTTPGQSLLFDKGHTPAILKALHGTDPPQKKKPKTIHRCILQTSTRPKGQALAISCHVCQAKYPDYTLYYNHLIDNTCSQQKKVRDLIIQNRKTMVPSAVTDSPTVSTHFSRGSLVAPTAVVHPVPTTSNLYERRREQNQNRLHKLEQIHFVQPAINRRRNHSDDLSSGSSIQSISPQDEAKIRKVAPTQPETSPTPMSPLNLSKSAPSIKVITAPEVPKMLPLKKRPSSTGPKCPHIEAATLKPISMVEHAEDQAQLANLKVQLTSLLVALLGEDRLGEMGHPDHDILQLLQSVLDAAGGSGELQGQCINCPADQNPPGNIQVRYRMVKRDIHMAKSSIRRLLDICVPDPDVWTRYGWKSKSIEDILADIQSRGIEAINRS